uniref:Uncharacterized protein n=1 Tax=Melopsittacus undulatus TaxID=13146 RepID=A0A8V5FLE8_MELUD
MVQNTPDRMESLAPSPNTVDMKLKITCIECHPECLIIVFQGQYKAGCELDYYILQNEIQRVFKVQDKINVGGSCLVEDTEGKWHRGRVLEKRENNSKVFLIDTGQVLVVKETHLASACDELFKLPPKVVWGVFASILPLGEKWGPKAINYFSSLVGLQITGHVKAVMPYQLFILEVPKIISDVLELQLGKFIDGDSFYLIVETLRAFPQEISTDFCPVPGDLFPRLPVGSQENVRITVAISPNRFYCQIQKWQKELEDLTGAMRLYYEAISTENVKSFGSLGLLCAAKSQNGKWHRGVIKQFLSDHVEVWFMDFGIIEAVPSSCVQKLKVEFMALPMVSFPCALSCFDSQDETVIKTQLKELMQALIEQTSVCVRVDLFNDIKCLYYVTLQKQTLGIHAKQSENLNEAVASCVSLPETKITSIAVNYKPCYKRYNSLKNCAENKCTKNCLPKRDISLSSHCKRVEMKINSFHTAFIVYVINPSNFWIQIYEYQYEFQTLMKNIEATYSQSLAMCCALACTFPVDEIWVQNEIDFFKDKVFNTPLLESVVLSCFGKDAVAERCKLVREEKLFYKEFVFKPGAVFEVVCSCIVSPVDFSCQLQSKLPELNKLMEQIQSYYEEHTSPYKTGQLACIVKSPKDGKWYRATVVQQVSTNEVDVIFVDYGYRERVLLKDLQAVLPDFLILESQAFRCALKNVLLQIDLLNWSEEMCKRFEDFISASRGPLTCIIYALALVSPNCLCNIVDLQTPFINAEEFFRELGGGLNQSEYTGLRNLASLGSLYSFCYSSFNLKVGDEEEIYITHIHSPTEFYCQLNRNTETLETLMKKVSAISKMPNNAKYDTSSTQLCIARYFEDGLFYRALAYPVESASCLCADFVDFGNQSVVERDQLMPIPDFATDLIFTPMQAIKCCLSDLRETKIPARVTRWFEETFLDKLLKAVIVSRESDGQILVELYDGQLKVSQRIKEKVLEELTLKNYTQRFIGSSRGVVCHMEDDKESNKVTANNPKRVTLKTEMKCHGCSEYSPADTGQNFGDEENAECITQKLGSGSSKPPTSQDREEPVHRNTISAVQEHREEPLVGEPALNSKEATKNAVSESHNDRLNYTSQQERSNENVPKLISLPQRDIQVDSEVVGYISHVNSPSSFYVQFAEDENLITQLAKELNETMENTGHENGLDEPMVGDLIVAEYDTDCFYYRAVIKALKQRNSVEIEFIDYGNAAIVSPSKICRIQKKFLTLPRLSVHCFLSRVKSVPSESRTNKSTSCLVSRKNNKLVTCKFLQQHGEQWEIDVICDGKSVPQYRRSRNGLVDQSKTKAVRMKNTFKIPLNVLSQYLNSGQVEGAEVVNILDSGEFHVQLLRNVEVLHELNVVLVKEAQRSDLLGVDDIEEGLECMTKSEINLEWYRSRVIKKFVQEKLMLVFFMDYGRYEMVSLYNAKMLSDEIRNIPKQAVFCKWVWFKKIKKNQFVHVVNALLDHGIRILFLRYLECSHIWEVDILIGEILLQEYLDMLLSHCQTIVRPEKSSNTDCKVCDTSLKKNSITWLLRSGRRYPGFVTAVTDPSNFCVQFESLFGCMQNLSLLLSDLPDNLPALPQELVAPGASCLIKFGLEAQWSRAEISEVTSQSVVLRFIDYGFLKSIPYSDIHKLKVITKSLSYLPHLAYSCSLHDVVPAKGEYWSDEAKLLFQELLSNLGLIFHFKHYGSEMKLEVDVLHKENNLAHALIAAGHAACYRSRCCLIPVDGIKSEKTDL